MLGMAKIGDLSDPSAKKNSLASAVTAGKYPYLYDKATKNWTTSTTVRNVFVMGSGGVGTSLTQTNSWMNGGMGHRGSVGPELGIGGMLEASIQKPIMLLKSCIGDRALGWDILPPGSKSFECNNYTYAGYHQSPNKWPVGTTPVCLNGRSELGPYTCFVSVLVCVFCLSFTRYECHHRPRLLGQPEFSTTVTSGGQIKS
eukprot:SAG31_NODE_1158_length_9605_cov_2.788555_3_plen_200_part_00